MRPVLAVMLVVCGCGSGSGSVQIYGANPLDFGALRVGLHKTLPVTLANPGPRDVDLTLESSSTIFNVDTVPAFIPAQGTRTINVTFSPRTPGDQGAALVFRWGSEFATLNVTGTATAPDCAMFSAIDFGKVMVQDTAARRLDGATLDRVTGIGFDAVADATGVQVTFRPLDGTAHTGSLTVRGGEGCPQVTVPLSGTGVISMVECEPAVLDFGFITPGLTKASSLRVRNHGLMPVVLSNLQTRIGTNPSSEYRIVGGATTVTAPAEGTVEIQLTFTPANLGLRNGALVMATPSSTQPLLSCPLRGTGGGPDIDLRPTSLDFGRVPIFAGSGVTRKVTVRNLGTRPQPPDPLANLHIQRWDVIPKNMASIAADICVGTWSAGQCSSSLATYNPAVGLTADAASFLDVPIRVMPSRAGSLEWDVVFHSNDPDEAAVTVNVKAQGISLPPCDYVVTPPALSFGLLASGKSLTLPFQITNIGQNDCFITSLDLDPNTPAIFSLPGGPLTEVDLLSGQSMFVLVKAQPFGPAPTAVQTLMGSLSIYASSPAAPRTQVQLSAQLGPPCLRVTSALDFGTVKTGCASAPKTVVLYNGCANGVQLQSASLLQTNEFSLVSSPGSMPLPPAAHAMFTVEYEPQNVGSDVSALLLKIDQSGVIVDFVTKLSGVGNTTGQHTDVWTLPSQPKLDVLVVVDNSPSMFDEQARLMGPLGTLFGDLARQLAQNFDIHLAVTTGDLAGGSAVGTLVGAPAVLTATTPNLDGLFRQRLMVGTNGSGMRGIAEPAWRAVTSVSNGFLRDDAALVILGITDGPDGSPAAAAAYEHLFLDLKHGRREDIVYSVIGPSWPARMGCNTDDAWPNVSKLRQLTLAFGGGHTQICDSDWFTDQRILPPPMFTLTGEADPMAPLSMTIDMTPVPPTDPTGAQVWTYSAATNAVSFAPLFRPAPGQQVTATYTAVCH